METHSNILAWRIPWTEEHKKQENNGMGKTRDLVKTIKDTKGKKYRLVQASILPVSFYDLPPPLASE